MSRAIIPNAAQIKHISTASDARFITVTARDGTLIRRAETKPTYIMVKLSMTHKYTWNFMGSATISKHVAIIEIIPNKSDASAANFTVLASVFKASPICP